MSSGAFKTFAVIGAWLRSVLPPGRCRVLASLLILSASYCYVRCDEHWCMGGHMEHPPYGLAEYLNDAWWLVAFPLAALLAIKSDLVGRFLFCGAAAALLVAKFTELKYIYSFENALVLQGLWCLAAVGLFNGFKRVVPLKTWMPYVASEVILAAGLVAVAWGLSQTLATSEPEAWKNIRIGMQKEKIHSLIGEPNVLDQRRKNSQRFEAWQTKGFLDNLEIAVWYSDSNSVRMISVARVPKVGLGYKKIRAEHELSLR